MAEAKAILQAANQRGGEKRIISLRKGKAGAVRKTKPIVKPKASP